MESVASNNTQAVIKNCPVFAGTSKVTLHEYKTKLRACLSLYKHSEPVFEVFQGKVQPSSTMSSVDTSTLDVIAERTWTQANQDLWSVLLLPTIPFKSLRASGRKMERGTDRQRGRLSPKNTTATLRRPEGRAMRSSPTPKRSPGKIRMTFSSCWTYAVTYFTENGAHGAWREVREYYFTCSPH